MTQLPFFLLCFAREPVYDFIIQLLTCGGESPALHLPTFPLSFASRWSPSNYLLCSAPISPCQGLLMSSLTNTPAFQISPGFSRTVYYFLSKSMGNINYKMGGSQRVTAEQVHFQSRPNSKGDEL